MLANLKQYTVAFIPINAYEFKQTKHRGMGMLSYCTIWFMVLYLALMLLNFPWLKNNYYTEGFFYLKHPWIWSAERCVRIYITKQQLTAYWFSWFIYTLSSDTLYLFRFHHHLLWVTVRDVSSYNIRTERKTDTLFC